MGPGSRVLDGGGSMMGPLMGQKNKKPLNLCWIQRLFT